MRTAARSSGPSAVESTPVNAQLAWDLYEAAGRERSALERIEPMAAR
jgi:hypothetical protein